MYPKHLAQKCRRVLRVPTGLDVTGSLIVGRAAVSGRDVKIVIVTRARTESDPAAIVICLRLIE